MQLDPKKYLRYLDGCDMTEEEKLAYVQNVWAVMESFVDRAFGGSPEQAALSAKDTRDGSSRPGRRSNHRRR